MAKHIHYEPGVISYEPLFKFFLHYLPSSKIEPPLSFSPSLVIGCFLAIAGKFPLIVSQYFFMILGFAFVVARGGSPSLFFLSFGFSTGPLPVMPPQPHPFYRSSHWTTILNLPPFSPLFLGSLGLWKALFRPSIRKKRKQRKKKEKRRKRK